MLEQYEPQFITGCEKNGLTTNEANDLWRSLQGFADYGFNKSHAVAYSAVTYLCAYFKANYPQEFFCALMSIRSQDMQPKDWAGKAPQYMNEARKLGVDVRGPSVQKSAIGFTIDKQEIRFGLNAIRAVGVTAARSILRARGRRPFEDIYDFLGRINTTKVTTKVFESLAHAGAFDCMGYDRQWLVDNVHELYKYQKDMTARIERELEIVVRDTENAAKDARKAEIDTEIGAAKAEIKLLKKAKEPISERLQYIVDRPKRLKSYKEIAAQVHNSSGDLEDALSPDQIKEYEESLWLRKSPTLKPKKTEQKLEPKRNSEITLTVEQLLEAQKYVGCFIDIHPAKIVFPNTTSIDDLFEDEDVTIAGQVIETKQITTRKGQPMMILQIGDDTGVTEAVIFTGTYLKLKKKDTLPETGQLIACGCKVQAIDPAAKVIVNTIDVYR